MPLWKIYPSINAYPLLLVARCKGRLDEAAAELASHHGTKVETLAIDFE